MMDTDDSIFNGRLPLVIESFSGKNRVVCAFREVARQVAEKNSLCADVDSILFVIDEATEKQARTASDISRISPLWHDVLFQITLRHFYFVIKFYNVNLEAMRGNAKMFAALLYHEMRHIKKNSKTGLLYMDKTHEIEDWAELAKYGDWERNALNAAELPNLLQESILRKEIE